MTTPLVDAIRRGKRTVVFIDQGQRKGDAAIIMNLSLNESQMSVIEDDIQEEISVTRLAMRLRFSPMSETVVLVTSQGSADFGLFSNCWPDMARPSSTALSTFLPLASTLKCSPHTVK